MKYVTEVERAMLAEYKPGDTLVNKKAVKMKDRYYSHRHPRLYWTVKGGAIAYQTADGNCWVRR